MKFPYAKWTLLSLTMAVLAVFIKLGAAPNSPSVDGANPAGDLAGFSALAPIDAHVHVYKDDPAFGAFLERLNLRVLDICVIDDRDPDYWVWNRSAATCSNVVQSTNGRAVFCTTFSPYGFEEPGFSQRAIQQLDADFAAGAIAVKIYKVMGMEMKSKAGKYVHA